MGERCESLVACAVARIGALQPDRPGVTDELGTITYAELSQLAGVIRHALETSTNPDNLLGLEMAPLRGRVAALLACEATGRSVVLLPPRLPAAEFREVLRNSGLQMMLEPESVRTGNLVRLTRIPGKGGPRVPHSIVQITSGSLGASRLAVRTWRGVWIEIESISARLGLTAADRVLCASSIAHSYGLIGGLLAPLAAGAHVVLSSSDLPTTDIGPTVLFGLSRSYRSLLTNANSARELGGVRFALSAGAPLAEGLFDSFLRHSGVPIRQDYGTTETGTICIDDAVPVRPDTVGRRLPHIQLRIMHPGPSFVAPEDGEVQVRSAAIAAGYLKDGMLVPSSDQDGWYHTRDAGSLDPSGNLTLGHRLRLPVEIEGSPISLDQIEAKLAGIPGVREVVALSFDRGGKTAIKAVVATDMDAATLAARSALVLPTGHRPTEYQIVDTLPRSPAGKVLQKYLM